MPLDIYQLGGYTGSYAGDCFVIGDGKSFLMIDLGMNMNSSSTAWSGTQNQKAMDLVRGATDLDVIVTHCHQDHVNSHKSWKDLAELNAVVHYGPSIDPAGYAPMSKVQKLRSHRYAHSHSGSLCVEKNFGDWKLQCFLIVPDVRLAPKRGDENHASMGVLLELSKQGSDPVNILSLGDMSVETGEPAVREVLRQRGYLAKKKPTPLTSVKLSHHGSEDNLLPVLNDVVTEGCTVVISGYTLTALSKLAAKLEEWKPKQTFMLFDKRGWQDASPNIGETTMQWAVLNRAGIQVITDFHVSLT